MTLAIVYSRASAGIAAPLVTVETHLARGMAKFNIVGLPEAAVKESRDRVRSALLNTQFEFPIKRITVNLAPADLPKEGGRFDLPIAMGILAASGQLPANALLNYELLGELALSGELRPIRGTLSAALNAQKANRHLIIPLQNAKEASLVAKANVLYATHLLEVCAHIKGIESLPICTADLNFQEPNNTLDLADVKGQSHAKRALEIAAAGQHSLLFIGPPGTGKTMLASRLPSILPELNEQEALETAAIASLSSNGFNLSQWKQIPFRSPHHTSSAAALSGGGRPPRPGEISLAHGGVLFLDELPEFNRSVLECLREPIESGQVTISRAAFQTIFPAKFQFLAAMNPCPCGYSGSKVNPCQCTDMQIKKYLSKLSGPLLDRIDMHVEVAHLPPSFLTNKAIQANEESKCVRERVRQARHYQLTRQKKSNAQLTVKELNDFSYLGEEAERLLHQVMTKFHFSARSYHRIIKLARTIADLEESPIILVKHISEALNYRHLDRIESIT